jgi:hypothetical protein
MYVSRSDRYLLSFRDVTVQFHDHRVHARLNGKESVGGAHSFAVHENFRARRAGGDVQKRVTLCFRLDVGIETT